VHVQASECFHSQLFFRSHKGLFRLAVNLGLVICCITPVYGDEFTRVGTSSAPASSPTTPQQAAPTVYAPITLRAPSTSLSQQEPRDDAHDSSLLRRQRADEAAAGSNQRSDDSDAGASARRSTAAPLVTIASSLALVLGLFAAFVWASRKAQRGRGISRPIPDEVLRVLGQKHLGTLGTISIIRCGRSVIVVSQSASGIQSLATITDEAEVRHLEAACLGESTASFQAALSEIEREPAGRGFLGEGIAQPNARKKLFTQA